MNQLRSCRSAAILNDLIFGHVLKLSRSGCASASRSGTPVSKVFRRRLRSAKQGGDDLHNVTDTKQLYGIPAR